MKNKSKSARLIIITNISGNKIIFRAESRISEGAGGVCWAPGAGGPGGVDRPGDDIASLAIVTHVISEISLYKSSSSHYLNSLGHPVVGPVLCEAAADSGGLGPGHLTEVPCFACVPIPRISNIFSIVE